MAFFWTGAKDSEIHILSNWFLNKQRKLVVKLKYLLRGYSSGPMCVHRDTEI